MQQQDETLSSFTFLRDSISNKANLMQGLSYWISCAFGKYKKSFNNMKRTSKGQHEISFFN